MDLFLNYPMLCRPRQFPFFADEFLFPAQFNPIEELNGRRRHRYHPYFDMTDALPIRILSANKTKHRKAPAKHHERDEDTESSASSFSSGDEGQWKQISQTWTRARDGHNAVERKVIRVRDDKGLDKMIEERVVNGKVARRRIDQSNQNQQQKITETATTQQQEQHTIAEENQQHQQQNEKQQQELDRQEPQQQDDNKDQQQQQGEIAEPNATQVRNEQMAENAEQVTTADSHTDTQDDAHQQEQPTATNRKSRTTKSRKGTQKQMTLQQKRGDSQQRNQWCDWDAHFDELWNANPLTKQINFFAF